MENERKMKIKTPFTKKNLTIILLLVGLTANSFFIGYYIGADLKAERDKCVSTIILVPVEIKAIDDLFFFNIVVELLHIEGIDPKVQVRFYNDDLSIYVFNATLIRIEFIIIELYYYFRIIDWFYTYIRFDLEPTQSFTQTDITFWQLIQIDVEDGGKY